MSKLPLRTVSLHLPGSGLMQCKMRGPCIKTKSNRHPSQEWSMGLFFIKGLSCCKELSSVQCHKIFRQICFYPVAEKMHRAGFMKE